MAEMVPMMLGLVTNTLEAVAAMVPMKLGLVTKTGCEACTLFTWNSHPAEVEIPEPEAPEMSTAVVAGAEDTGTKGGGC